MCKTSPGQSQQRPQSKFDIKDAAGVGFQKHYNAMSKSEFSVWLIVKRLDREDNHICCAATETQNTTLFAAKVLHIVNVRINANP